MNRKPIPKYIYQKMLVCTELQKKANNISFELYDWLEENGYADEDGNLSDVLVDTIDYGHGNVDSTLNMLGYEYRK